MKITLNGLDNPSNIITLSGCPTILTVNDSGYGDKAMLAIEVSSLNSVTEGNNIYIEINGERITSTYDLNEVINRNFYISNDNSLTNKIFVAQTIVNALRSCPQLDANYNIYQGIQSSTLMSNIIYVVAKDIGSQNNLTYSTNASLIFNIRNTIGSSTGELASNIKTMVSVDIYALYGNTQPRLGGDTVPNGEYVTTLRKQYYKDETHFDISPILTTLTSYNETVAYLLYVYATIDNKLQTLGQIGYNYVVNGYSVNQGGTYIPNFTNVKLAQNVSRGTSRTPINSTILYTYEPRVIFSLFSQSNINSLQLTVSYKDSQLNELASESKTIFITNNLTKVDLGLNTVNFGLADYIDISIPNLGVLRYNIIKPLNATIENYRIFYNNSYGGVSFFDFTGDRKEDRKLTVDTYQKQLFDYYKSSLQELEKVYNKDTTITVTLKSHLIPKDATWQFYDMQNSTNAWTEINGTIYSIIINDVSVDETSTDGVYEATVKYTYSLADDFN